jgi:hypothetical protein
MGDVSHPPWSRILTRFPAPSATSFKIDFWHPDA